jgi:hypothetical protein
MSIWLQTLFEDYQSDEFSTNCKLVNAVPQRWSSMCKVLERVLKVWGPFKQAYDGEPVPAGMPEKPSTFPLNTLHNELLELYSMLRLLVAITNDVQGRDYSTAAVGWFSLVCLRHKELSADGKLPIYNPARCVRGRVVMRFHDGGRHRA